MKSLNFVWLAAFCLVLAAIGQAQESAAQKYLISVERIYDRAPHSAFTDLVEFNGKLYCTFREGSGHVPGKQGTNGTIRILVSTDGQNWQSAALLSEDRVDLRDPKLSVTPDGRLMVLMGDSFYEAETLKGGQTRVSFSDKLGKHFSAPQPVVMDAEIRSERDWLWRVNWHRGIAYGVVYQSGGEEFKALLVSSRDGIHYRLVTSWAIAGRPNETTLRFMPDGEMIAWVRRDGGNQNGFIGTSRAPYKEWSWKEQSARLGGPEFIALPDGTLVGATRGHLEGGKRNTYLAWLKRDGSLSEIVALPSGGDTSYAGMVLRGNTLLVSYYASHEGKSAIYLATLNVKALMKR